MVNVDPDDIDDIIDSGGSTDDNSAASPGNIPGAPGSPTEGDPSVDDSQPDTSDPDPSPGNIPGAPDSPTDGDPRVDDGGTGAPTGDSDPSPGNIPGAPDSPTDGDPRVDDGGRTGDAGGRQRQPGGETVTDRRTADTDRRTQRPDARQRLDDSRPSNRVQGGLSGLSYTAGGRVATEEAPTGDVPTRRELRRRYAETEQTKPRPDLTRPGAGDPRTSLDQVRFAEERTQIGGETIRRGEALPTEAQIADILERQTLEASGWADRNLGGDDVRVTRDDEGFQTSVRQSAVERELRQQDAAQAIALARAERRLEEQVGARETARDFGPDATLSPATAAQLEDTPDLERGLDYTVGPEGQVRLTDEYRRQRAVEQVREQIREQTPATGYGFQAGDELDVNFSGGETSVTLTAEGRRDYIRQVAAETGEVGGQEVQSLDQLEFSEEGELTGVAEPQDAGFWENFVKAQRSGLVGVPGAAAVAGTEETLDVVEDVSGDAAEYTSDVFETGVAGLSSRMAVASPYGSPTAAETDPQEIDTPGEAFFAGTGRGITATTIGAPEQLSTTGEIIGSGGAFTVEQPRAAPAAGVAFAGATASQIAEAAQERPSRFAGNIVGGSIAGTAISPIRFGRIDVPRTGETTTLPRPTRPGVDIDTPTQPTTGPGIPDGPVVFGREITPGTGSLDIERPRLERPEATPVRGIRLRDPILYESLTGRVDAGDTLIGFAGARPTVGAPEIDPRNLDFGELSGRGETFEPIGGFESEVFGASARAAGGQAARRYSARDDLMTVGESVDSELTLETTEDIVREARAVPESAATDVAKALEDIGATIEGSAAVRAQLEGEFRQPRDVDILVSDKAAAQTRLSQALEGETADVGDVFDIKVEGEGRPDVGEFIKGGRTAQPRLETEGGVQVTPIGEELIRKSSASGFLRGEGSPSREFTGRTEDFDIGPEPAREGERPRFKDPADAFEIGRAVAPQSEAVSQFGRAFETEITQASRGPSEVDLDEPAPATVAEADTFDTGIWREFGEFIADEQAQATTAGLFGRVNVDRPRGMETDFETDATTTTRRGTTDTNTDTDVSPSPGRVDASPSPAFGVTSPTPGVVSPSASPTTESETAFDSPTVTVTDPTDSPTGGFGDIGDTPFGGGGFGESPGGVGGGDRPGVPTGDSPGTIDSPGFTADIDSPGIPGDPDIPDFTQEPSTPPREFGGDEDPDADLTEPLPWETVDEVTDTGFLEIDDAFEFKLPGPDGQ
jgi:hypothetical protein